MKPISVADAVRNSSPLNAGQDARPSFMRHNSPILSVQYYNDHAVVEHEDGVKTFAYGISEMKILANFY